MGRVNGQIRSKPTDTMFGSKCTFWSFKSHLIDSLEYQSLHLSIAALNSGTYGPARALINQY